MVESNKVLVFIVPMVLIAMLHEVNAECCGGRKLTAVHRCIRGRDVCRSEICFDGTILRSGSCSVGSCNGFGCDCEGGCRRNPKGFQKNEAKKLFERRYGVFVRHIS